MRTKILIAFFAIVLCSCTTMNFNEGSSRLFVAKSADTNGSLNNGHLFFHSDDNLAAQNIIHKDDYFSIKLISTFICNFREGKSFSEYFEKGDSNKFSWACNNFTKNSKSESGDRQSTRGEILIAANIGELKNTSKIGFDMANLRSGGRVVYYNQDVRESGQLINAMNLPIYGPRKYEGYPFLMDLSILELDNDESNEIKEMLGKLADLGVAASANPIISSVVKPLGDALVSSNTDDLEMRYIMTFDEPGAVDSQVPRLQLREGYYAVIRKEARDKIADTKNLCVDTKTGLLLETIESGQCELMVKSEFGINNVYRDATWLLLRVSKEDPNSLAANQLNLLESLDDFFKRDKAWDTAGQNQQQALEQLTNNLETYKQTSLIDKQIKATYEDTPDFKSTPAYVLFLLEKLTPVNTNGNLSDHQKIQLEVNANILERLNLKVINMPCLPYRQDTNYESKITNLKARLTDANVAVFAQTSGLFKVTEKINCD